MPLAGQESARRVSASSVIGTCKPNVLTAVVGQHDPLPQSMQVLCSGLGHAVGLS